MKAEAVALAFKRTAGRVMRVIKSARNEVLFRSNLNLITFTATIETANVRIQRYNRMLSSRESSKADKKEMVTIISVLGIEKSFR